MPSPSGWQAQHDADYRAHWHALAARADPDALTWVVLGDSAAVGIGAESPSTT
ncbi:MAG TPA: lysophospholipase, partial [Micrococcus luteus]|nr:lysophospholipase [Micrococcus luteus]